MIDFGFIVLCDYYFFILLHSHNSTIIINTVELLWQNHTLLTYNNNRTYLIQ